MSRRTKNDNKFDVMQDGENVLRTRPNNLAAVGDVPAKSKKKNQIVDIIDNGFDNVLDNELEANQDDDIDADIDIDIDADIDANIDVELDTDLDTDITLSLRFPSNMSLPIKAPERPLPVKVFESDTATTQLSLLQRYFYELRKYPLLSAKEEFDLATEFSKTQDPDIAFRLTTANLRLVVKIAMEYQNAVANVLDLIQEGNIGLMQAVKKFDPQKGIRLSSYAQWWIRAYILKYLVNNARLVKVGTTQAQRKLFFNLRKEKEKLENLGFNPEPALLAQRLEVRVDEVEEMEQRMARADLSLDLPIGDDHKQTIGDLMPSQEFDAEVRVIDKDLREQMRYQMDKFASTLKERERVLWEYRIDTDEPLTLQEIGNMFGVTRERARQIEKDMLRRFREFIQDGIPDLDVFDLG
jgi:RNA polymerase sigma-32 factor